MVPCTRYIIDEKKKHFSSFETWSTTKFTDFDEDIIDECCHLILLFVRFAKLIRKETRFAFKYVEELEKIVRKWMDQDS